MEMHSRSLLVRLSVAIRSNALVAALIEMLPGGGHVSITSRESRLQRCG